MKTTSLNRQDLAVGVIFIVIGLFFGAYTYLYPLAMGTARVMGPGYFPAVLAGLLIVLGVVVVATGLVRASPPLPPMPWRGIAVLMPVPILFGLTIRGLGLVPTVAYTTFLAAFASQRMTVRTALWVTVALTVFCALIFHYGLRLPLSLFGAWTGPFAALG